DGDNNPWPQRFAERRIRIRPRDRARWGALRRIELLKSLSRLGFPHGSADFLRIPDQGVTPALMRGHERPVNAIAAVIASFSPTFLIVPSPDDLHPDHSALFLMTRLALASLDSEAP